jgi:hypothetical protein
MATAISASNIFLAARLLLKTAQVSLFVFRLVKGTKRND